MELVVGIKSSLDRIGTTYCIADYSCIDKCVMTAKYKIAGIWYTKPFLSRGADGEVSHTRVAESFFINQPSNFDGYGLKKVVDIVYDEDNRLFSVFFDKGGLKIVQYQYDTEVTYQMIDAKQQDETK
jgi:hypothetical protein